MKKGTKVIYPLLGNDIARVDRVLANGKVEIKYPRSKYVIEVEKEDLKRVN